MNLDFFSTQNLIALLLSFLIIGISILLAKSKQRSPMFWGVLALFFGVYALFVLIFLPKKTEVKTPLGEKTAQRPLPIVSSNGEKKELASESKGQQADTLSTDQLATAGWFFVNDKKEVDGPHGLKKIQDLAAQGKVTMHSWVWCELFSQWRKIETDKLLQSVLIEQKVSTNEGEGLSPKD